MEPHRTVPARIDLAHAFASIREHFAPHVAAELNGQMVKLVKFAGPFVWHSHPNEDELFLVWRGNFRMELRDRIEELSPGQMLLIPRGVEHRPVASSEVEVILFEPAGTLNTGDAVGSTLTRHELPRLE